MRPRLKNTTPIRRKAQQCIALRSVALQRLDIIKGCGVTGCNVYRMRKIRCDEQIPRRDDRLANSIIKKKIRIKKIG